MSRQGSIWGGSECSNRIKDATFLIVFHSNYGYISLSFQDMTTSCVAARRVRDCDSRPPVLVCQHPGLPGWRLSARCRRPCQITAFCQHSNTHCQSDAQQFLRQDLCRRRTTVWNSLPPNLRLCGLLYGQFRPLLKTFVFGQWAHGAVWTVLTAPCRNILSYLLSWTDDGKCRISGPWRADNNCYYY